MEPEQNDLPVILIVDDDHINHMVAREVLKSLARIDTAKSGSDALGYLELHKPKLVLMDIRMPGMDGFETFRRIREMPAVRDVPVVFLTSEVDPDIEARCFADGAQDFVRKPFVPAVLINRVKRVLEQQESRIRMENMIRTQARELTQRMEQIDEMQETLLIGLADMIEFRDEGTGNHVRQTQLYVELIAFELKKRGIYTDILTDEYIRNTIKAAPLHDIGKIHVPDYILQKPGKLTEEEFEEIKKHPLYGADIIDKTLKKIADNSYIDVIHDIVLYHHERWDGKGYPTGKAGEEIPLCARIMSVADVFDALFEDRVYKPGIKPISSTMDIMRKGQGTQFDPKVLEVFLDLTRDLQLLTGQD
ncbi:MAG: response regulator [Lachnospiraceae bacterium]|nr:response regulator [Lachnospiraceae bacterium]